MKIGIIGALDCEITEFCKNFSASETKFKGIYEGTCGDKKVFICLAGVGKVNAAVAAQKLFDMFDVDAVINSGVAGGVSRTLGICDIAISDSLTYHDFTPIDVLDKYEPHCSVFKADKKMISLAEKACEVIAEKEENFRFATGMIVSGDMFVEDSDYVKYLSDKYSALCTEMEGAAIAHVCVLNNKPFVVIRALSDNADENADMSFEQMASIAAKRACAVAEYIIRNI